MQIRQHILTTVAEPMHVDLEERSIHGEEVARKSGFGGGDFEFHSLLNQLRFHRIRQDRGRQNLK